MVRVMSGMAKIGVDTVLKLVISGVIMWEWREGNREIELYS
jgi:hypothetical protein